MRYGSGMNEHGGGGGGHFSGPEPCGVCGGDGYIDNTGGMRAKCPSCHGSGKRRHDTGFHDVTKTKESHYRPTNVAVAREKSTWPTSPAGIMLANQVRDAAKLSEATKARVIREIIEHESSHGQPTKTFLKKVRKEYGLLPPKV